MEFKVKSGYLLVEQQEGFNYNLVGDFICAKIVVSAPEDLGVLVFTDKYVPFNSQYLLVKIEDVAVFIKPEALNEPKND